ncbi:S41 family peptidase [Myxococcus sp. K15C18031901]|uniref:S41 family peptidase n=1 Tax=Myxococcus dinghuensis TaxID=2906761 RepID=UPI0020A80174|nr:S41 family peptidase [Myxococcus dinghuensis]MCP3102669.1 S41 family peptidase [Myxococcus dinghuensis]
MSCRSWYWSLALLLSLSGCGDADPEPTLEGVWTTDGYGFVVRFEGDTVALHELTTVSCLLFTSGPLEDGSLRAAGLNFRLANDKLLIEDGGTLHITGHRTRLPEVCTRAPAPSNDPVFNFEVFWRTFAEQYALFDLYGVDWQARYERFRARVSDGTTDDELFAILSESLAPLTDGHIGLIGGTRRFQPKAYPADFEAHRAEITNYIFERLLAGPGVTVTAENRMAYQSLDERVGYIFVTRMDQFSPHPTDGAAGNAEAAGRALDEALEALSDKDALIIDVRFNPGGYDAISLALASRFTDVERIGFSKKTRDGDGHTPLRAYRIAPAGPRQFLKPVYLLTSGATASAAENFTLAMSGLPQVTIVGDRTMGAQSDILTRQMPNGWTFWLSPEIYQAPDGEVYERIGVPPDVEVALDAASLVAGSDRILQEALRLARTGG